MPLNGAGHTFSKCITHNLPNNSGSAGKIIALTVDAGILYVEYGDGSLYYSSTNLAQYPTSITFDKIGDKFSLCSIDSAESALYGASYIQSNIVSGINQPQTLSGLYLCGGSMVYTVSLDNPESVTYPIDPSKYKISHSSPIKSSDKGVITGVSSDPSGDIFAVVKGSMNAKSNITAYDIWELPQSLNTWIQAFAQDEYGYAANQNFPFGLATVRISSIGVSPSTGNIYANMPDVNNPNTSTLMVSNSQDILNQWISLGSSFVINSQSSAQNMFLGYTDYTSFNDPASMVQPGYVIATDGTNWYTYGITAGISYYKYLDNNHPLTSMPPITYPSGDKEDSVAKLIIDYTTAYVLTKNGYVLSTAVGGSSQEWSVSYDWVNYGEPAVDIRSIADADGSYLFVATQDASGGTMSLVYWDGSIFTQVVDTEGNPLAISDWNITNTTAGVPIGPENATLNVLTENGDIYTAALSSASLMQDGVRLSLTYPYTESTPFGGGSLGLSCNQTNNTTELDHSDLVTIDHPVQARRTIFEYQMVISDNSIIVTYYAGGNPFKIKILPTLGTMFTGYYEYNDERGLYVAMEGGGAFNAVGFVSIGAIIEAQLSLPYDQVQSISVTFNGYNYGSPINVPQYTVFSNEINVNNLVWGEGVFPQILQYVTNPPYGPIGSEQTSYEGIEYTVHYAYMQGLSSTFALPAQSPHTPVVQNLCGQIHSFDGSDGF